jgi:hypothetical protein
MRQLLDQATREMEKSQTISASESDQASWAYHTKKQVKVKVLRRSGSRSQVEIPGVENKWVESKYLEES